MEAYDAHARVISATLRGDTVILSVAGADENERRRFRLTLEAYSACGAYKRGASLSHDDLDALARASAESEAILAAERALAASPKSARELYRNLRGKRHSHENALLAVRTAKEKGWIREDDQLYRLVPYLALRKLWGKRKLLPYLAAKGYAREAIENAVKRAETEGALDFSELRARLLDKHGPQSEEEQKKLLYKHGFDVYTED